MLKNKLLSYIVQFIHFIFILFIILTPFATNSIGFLFLHFIFVLFLLLHWSLNSNVCCLTLLEQKIKGLETEEDQYEHSFTYNVLNPIFMFNDKENTEKIINKASYAIIIICGMISILKLYDGYRYNNLTRFIELFMVYKNVY